MQLKKWLAVYIYYIVLTVQGNATQVSGGGVGEDGRVTEKQEETAVCNSGHC